MSINQKPIILNYQFALKASAGNEILAHKLLALFVKQLPDYIKNINNALHTIDLATLQNNIHKLNGALQYIGAPSLSQQVSELDGQIETLPPSNLVIKVNQILDSLENIRKEEKYQ
jgi:HPt (histidine-containing phosphotransfer) domain-containing protein